MHASHDGKFGCNTVEHTTVFLYSDWLYFLWHGMNLSMAMCDLYEVSSQYDREIHII